MPLAIVMYKSDALVDVVFGSTDAEVFAGLSDIQGAPRFIEQLQARLWLLTLPFPSGWYETIEEAKGRLEQLERHDPMSGYELTCIRARLGRTRAEFAERLGFKGTANTRHKQIWEMEKERKPIVSERARSARALLARSHLADGGAS